jgi:glycosidase
MKISVSSSLSLALLSLVLAFSCVTDPLAGPPPQPGRLKASREGREPIVPVAEVGQEEVDSLLQVPSPVWEEQIIYFVMTDRFDDGDPSNSDLGAGEYDPRVNAKYSGGDLQGILDNLDYIKGLGATALWITPPVANQWVDPIINYTGYHGYWARDFMRVDEHYGDLELYKELSATLHKNDMYLIQDIVLNHMGNFFDYNVEPLSKTGEPQEVWSADNPAQGLILNPDSKPVMAPEQSPFDQNNPTIPGHREANIYHWNPAVQDYNDPFQRVNYQLQNLDDLNTSNPLVRNALKESFRYWMEEVGVDAYRIDTVKYVEHDFLHDFHYSTDPENLGIFPYAKTLGKEGFFTFGEAWINTPPMEDQGDKDMAQYIGSEAKPELSSVLNFGLNSEITNVFGQGKPTSWMEYRVKSLYRNYPDPRKLPIFIDNHDMNRFMSGAGQPSMQAALLFLFSMPGIPVIYAGTAQEFTLSRQAMFADGYASGGEDHFDPTTELYQFIQELTALRKTHPALVWGNTRFLASTDIGAGTMAYMREYQGRQYLALFNTSRKNYMADNIDTGLSQGRVLKVLAGNNPAIQEVVVGSGGKVSALLGPYTALLLEVTEDLQAVEPNPYSIEVDNLLPGRTYKENLDLRGTVKGDLSQLSSLRMILDGDFNRGKRLSLQEDGSFVVPFKVDSLSNGPHKVVFQFQVQGSSQVFLSPGYPFTVKVDYVSMAKTDDPVGDDLGPEGRYLYPVHDSFGRQMDIEAVELLAAGSNLKVSITPTEAISKSWAPQFGFDHVTYYVYLDVPGKEGATVLPFQNAQTPEGFAWDYVLRVGGWMSLIHSSEGAGERDYGKPVNPAPLVMVDEEARKIEFIVTGAALGGLEDLSGVRVYITTWDYDGMESANRVLQETPDDYIMGGGNGQTDPLIMDDTTIITIP